VQIGADGDSPSRCPFTAEHISESVRAAPEQAARFEFATLRMLSSTDAATVLDLAARAVTPAVGRLEEFPQLAVLTTARDVPAAWLRAGQALQRVLLTATARGLSASFLYQSIELRDMRGDSAPPWPWPEIRRS
jgi:hypothetical protein